MVGKTKGKAAPAKAKKPAKRAASVKKAPAKPKTAPTPWEAFKASPDAIEQLCAHVVSGGHLADFCKTRGLAYTTVSDWINAEPGRAVMYARAREDRSDMLADEIVAISDEIDVKTRTGEDGEVHLTLDAAAVARNRLRVDARKWVASKLKPRVYGDKLELGGALKLSTVSDDVLLGELQKLGITAKIGPRPDGEAPGA